MLYLFHQAFICFLHCQLRISYTAVVLNSYKVLKALEGRKSQRIDVQVCLPKGTSKLKHLTILAHWWTMPPGNTVWNTRIHHTWLDTSINGWWDGIIAHTHTPRPTINIWHANIPRTRNRAQCSGSALYETNQLSNLASLPMIYGWPTVTE